ncbi:MAG: AcrB/AcrD/AcrF family protein, partial [Sphingomonas bacterium]|nr:AcrB/AcrD/AcrF family protein [Sphingomonas bacterium]
MIDRLNNWSVRHWRLIVLLFWLGYALFAIVNRWAAIRGFALGDTDDNLRLAQVRGLLDGQGWDDLVQYRLDPAHGGANIHWSRLVDLPLAGLMLALRPLLGGVDAERWAVAIAPLLAFLPMLIGLALVTRRIVDPRAVPLVLVTMLFAMSATGMVQPLRIDHHGWQLALLALALAGLADPRRRRGGVVVGLASAASLAIGLELLIYHALIGGATVLFWVADRAERGRLMTYAVSLSGGTALAFLLFASAANRAALCDALSPVWL